MTGQESQSSSATNICPYYRVGYCKYKENCKNIHPKENCDERKCSSRDCNKRHRKPCKFGQKCIRINSCEFLHDHKKNTEEIVNEYITKTEMESVIKQKDAKIEELSEKVKSLEDSIASINDKIKAVSKIEQAIIATRDRVDANEKKDETNTKQALRDSEEKVTLVKESVEKITVKVGRLEKFLVYMKNQQEDSKITGASQRASRGSSLPGPIPDRSTTLPGGATVIPV